MEEFAENFYSFEYIGNLHLNDDKMIVMTRKAMTIRLFLLKWKMWSGK